MGRSLRRSAVLWLTLVLCLVGAQVAAAQWSIQSIPNPPGGGIVRAISCVSGSSCIAVGLRFSGYGHGGPTGLVESWNGTQWSFSLAPKPRSADLEGVSCVSSRRCTAVGLRETRRGNRALVEGWNGTRWKVEPNPDSATTSELDGVSCASRTSCTAVGSAHRAGGGDRALVESWNGTGWKVQRNPANALQKSQLAGISCVSRSFCAAVGRSGHNGLIEGWNGKSWMIQPDGGGVGDHLLGVSCASSTSCATVGAAALGGDREAPFAESWDGTTWSAQPSATPSNTIGTLNGVSCASGTTCTAVGDDHLAERWDGSSWSTQTFHAPGQMSADLSGVSCPSTSLCTAVGDYIGNGYKAGAQPLAEMWTP